MLVHCATMAVFYVYALLSYSIKSNLVYHFEVASGIQEDTLRIKREEHLAAIKGCNQCHGADLSGKVMEDDPMVGRIVAPNLTRGKDGLDESYTTTDWMMVLQHGVGKEGWPFNSCLPTKQLR